MSKTTPHFDLMVEILTENRPSQHTGIPPTDSDKELIIQLLQFSGACLTRAQVEKIREFHFESLTRARRKLQRAGHFLPVSAAVRKKRQLMSFEIEMVAPNESAHGLQQRIAEPVA